MRGQNEEDMKIFRLPNPLCDVQTPVLNKTDNRTVCIGRGWFIPGRPMFGGEQVFVSLPPSLAWSTVLS